MLQLRFVLIALLILLTGAAALVVGTARVHDIVMPPYESLGTSSASAGIGAIAGFASQSVDAAAAAAANAEVAAAIEKGTLTTNAEAALLGKAGGFAPSFGLVIDLNGAIKAKSGADAKLPDNLIGLPIVAQAITGLSRDTLWVSPDGAATHLAASPIYASDGPNAIGAVVVGWPYTNDMLTSVSRLAQAPTFVVAGGKVVGTPPEGVSAENILSRQAFGEPTPTYGPLPVLVPERVRYSIASQPLYPGGDSGAALVTLVDRDAAYTGLATLQAGVFGATLALLAIVLAIIASTLRAVNKPLELISEHLSLVQQQGASVGILPEAGLGPMLRLGKQINMLLQNLPAAARTGGTAPLFAGGSSSSQDVPQVQAPLQFDSPPITTPTPQAPIPPVTPAATPQVSLPPTSSPGVAGASSMSTGPIALPGGSGSGPQAPAQPPGALAGLFDEGPDPLAAFRVPPSNPANTAPPEPEPEPPMPQPEATVMFQVPQSLLQASATKEQAPAAPSQPQQVSKTSVDDNRTVVAQVPQELLAQVSPKNDVGAADEAHYKEVYEKFVQTRIECGEDTSDLSYDRFVAKLLKNRQQIIEKHKAKSVRFQVYAKDGKAALRALPVRE